MRGYATVRYTFEQVRHTAIAKWRCSICNKRGRKQRTFDATINPWNVNEDGTQRTRSEIQNVLRAKGEAWRTETEQQGNSGLLHSHV
jgi:hypothetical protein